MKAFMFCGKGGVGKTNSAVALALHCAGEGKKTLVIDHDGGHSVPGTLGLEAPVVGNQLQRVKPALSIAVVGNSSFTSFMDSKNAGGSLPVYLSQFPDDYGILAFTDMINDLFGVPTDVACLQKFITLVVLLHQAARENFEIVIIDVEPTAGLERLLVKSQSTVRSLRNLKKKGWLTLAAVGTAWPDVAGFLAGDYIKNVDMHCERIEWTVRLFQAAGYYLVCVPEAGPVTQTFAVGEIIRRSGGSVRGFVINNLRDESHEERTIAPIVEQGLPVARISHRPELHTNHTDRTMLLTDIGHGIAAGLWNR